ncbi:MULTISPECIES: DUF4424 family protein [unclassified Acinetobacter]|uniref:DUF4424 family protein n=1 Tax=unclassified Acinetobacter TaxID=196816 RepID=UPI0035B79D5F
MKNLFTKHHLCLLATCLLFSTSSAVFANDSAGYVATGGVSYIKNPNISMHSEDLLISKDIIRVNYQYKNLSNQEIRENILFPLPKVDSFIDSDYADVEQLYRSFKIWANGQPIKPTIHVRTFMYPVKNGERAYPENGEASIDTTALFQACGISDSEMMRPWTQRDKVNTVSQKLLKCNNAELKKLLLADDGESDTPWQSQIIYSWQQPFKANSITTVKHEYQPLVGGSVGTSEDELQKHCADNDLRKRLKRFNESGSPFYNMPYNSLSYILTTANNWAKPIQDFKLTVQRDAGELVSLCWDGKVQKINQNTFEMREQNFTPKRDLDVIFIRTK